MVREEGSVSVSMGVFGDRECCLPVTIGWDDIINSQLLADLLDSQMQCVGLKLFASHVRNNSCGKTHEASGFVFGCITPSVSLLAAPRTISISA